MEAKKQEMIFAIDPGPTQSGWCLYDGIRVVESGVSDNTVLLDSIPHGVGEFLAIEMIASYGMAVGRDVFETCVWIGRFMQQWNLCKGVSGKHRLVYRKDVKMHLCGTMKAKDANIRQAIIDKFPATGGGKTPQIGIKSNPGPLFGVSSHAWPALGVALVVSEGGRCD